MENLCQFVMKRGLNRGRYCGVRVNEDKQFCCYHRFVAFRLNNKKKTLTAAVALRPKQEDCDKNYWKFPIEDYEEYEYYEDHGEKYLSFSSYEDEEEQDDYDENPTAVDNNIPLPPGGNITRLGFIPRIPVIQ